MSEDYDRRLANIKQTIFSYDQNFDFEELDRALGWARTMPPRGTPKNADDFFSDPVTIVEELVNFAQADRETILAAILYPAVMPIMGQSFNQDTLDAIAKQIPGKDNGARLCELIKNTLHFRSLNLPDIFEDKDINGLLNTQKAETVHLHLLMSLWAARDPRVILIGAVTNGVNIRAAINDIKGKIYNSTVRERLAINAEYVYSPLAYLAGYEEVRERSNDLCFQLKQPEKYQQIRQERKEFRKRIKVEEVEKLVREAIISRLEDAYHFQNWKHGEHFEVEFRQKSAYSIWVKLEKKKQIRAKRNAELMEKGLPVEEDQSLTLSDLADLFGARVIIKLPAIGLKSEDKVKFDNETRLWAMEELATQTSDVYSVLSGEFGRNNKRYSEHRIDEQGRREWFSYIQKRFDELAALEPRDQDEKRLQDPESLEREKQQYPHIRDARFNNYYDFPPPTGVKFIKDLMCFRKEKLSKSNDAEDEKYWEVECQVIDDLQYDIFMYGPKAGHIYYKTGLENHVHAVQHWFALAKAEVEGEKYNGPEHVYVLSAKGTIVELSGHPIVWNYAMAINLGFCETIQVNGVDSSFTLVRPDEEPDFPITNGSRISHVDSFHFD